MTKIEWTDESWNPVVGCTIVSPGCTNCYAMSQARRIVSMAPGSHYRGTTKTVNGKAVWTGRVKMAPANIIERPLRWTKPRLVFVNSMGDLFHEDVPDDWINFVFAVMALTPRHTYQVLTKRSARMRKYTNDPGVARRVHELAADIAIEKRLSVVLIAPGFDPAMAPAPELPRIFLGTWPLPNVWLGVSAERQTEADARVPHLLETPAAVRFVSAEPLLGAIDFLGLKSTECLALPGACCGGMTQVDALRGIQYCERAGAYTFPNRNAAPRGLDWIIAGGESGPSARPMLPDWPRSIRDQCAKASIPFFFKQWGEYLDGKRVGKIAAGRALDGRLHNEMPPLPAQAPGVPAL